MSQRPADLLTQPPRQWPVQAWHVTLVPVYLTDIGDTAVPVFVSWDLGLDLPCGLAVAAPDCDLDAALADYVETVLLKNERLTLYVSDVDLLPPWVWAMAATCGHLIADVDCEPSEQEAAFLDFLASAPYGDGPRNVSDLADTLSVLRDVVQSALEALSDPDEFEHTFDNCANVGYGPAYDDDGLRVDDEAGQTAALNPVGRVQDSDETPGA